MSVKNTNKVTIHIFYMIVTVQGEREHDEEEDMCQEKEKDRYAEKEMYPDEAHIATAPLAALDQFDFGEKDTGPKQPKLHHYPKEHFGLQKRLFQPNWFEPSSICSASTSLSFCTDFSEKSKNDI